jgi:hypothetical protein
VNDEVNPNATASRQFIAEISEAIEEVIPLPQFLDESQERCEDEA